VVPVEVGMKIDVKYDQDEKAFFVCWNDDIIGDRRDLEISTWCNKNFEDKEWTDGVANFNYLWTSSHKDVAMFCLRWS
jgi:hypothetical protein